MKVMGSVNYFCVSAPPEYEPPNYCYFFVIIENIDMKVMCSVNYFCVSLFVIRVLVLELAGNDSPKKFNSELVRLLEGCLYLEVNVMIRSIVSFSCFYCVVLDMALYLPTEAILFYLL